MTADHTVEWQPCSDASRERDDPMSGTAGLGERWLLVEIDGGWGAHAFVESRLDPADGRALVSRAERAGIRPVAIRRPGRRTAERRGLSTVRWALVDARPGREEVRWDTVADAADLLEVPLDGSVGVADEEPLVLVCAHGRHDRCCAVRGRPVAAALHEAAPEATWESSHLGGDRFAPTLILLPSALMYGRVPAERAGFLLDEARAGRVVPEYLRGRACYPLPVQAAQAAARARTGDLRVDAYPPIAHEPVDGGWLVRLQDGTDELRVRLRQDLSPPLLSMCDATRAMPVPQLVASDVERVPVACRLRPSV